MAQQLFVHWPSAQVGCPWLVRVWVMQFVSMGALTWRSVCWRAGLDVVVLETACVPDEPDDIHAKIKHWCDDIGVDFVLTTGGTGFAVRLCLLAWLSCRGVVC